MSTGHWPRLVFSKAHLHRYWKCSEELQIEFEELQNALRAKMSESAAEIQNELEEIKSIAVADKKKLEEIKWMKVARIQRQKAYDNIFNLHYTALKLLKINRSKSLNKFEVSIQKLKTLDNQIAEIGLNHSFKMIQLKIRYQLEISDLIETSQQEILGLIRDEIRAKENLKEAKSMQRGNREVLRRIEEIEILLKKKIDYSLQLVERIEKVEELRRKVKMNRICIVVLRFVIFILVLIILFRN